LQLEAARRRANHLPLKLTRPCQLWSRSTYPLLSYNVFTADTLLYAVTLTFDLWLWTFLVCRMWRDELCTKFEQNSTIRGGVIAIWIYDLITLNTVTLAFNPLTLNVCSRSDVTWLNPVPNLSEIEHYSRLSYWRFNYLLKGGGLLNSTPQKRSTKLRQVWGEQSSITAAPDAKPFVPSDWFVSMWGRLKEEWSRRSRTIFTVFTIFKANFPCRKNQGRSGGECWVGISSWPYDRICGTHLMGGYCEA